MNYNVIHVTTDRVYAQLLSFDNKDTDFTTINLYISNIRKYHPTVKEIIFAFIDFKNTEFDMYDRVDIYCLVEFENEKEYYLTIPKKYHNKLKIPKTFKGAMYV